MSKEIGKFASAEKAIENFIKYTEIPLIVGIGSGSTIVYAVELLAEQFKDKKLNIRCIPTSYQAKQLIISNGLPLGDLEEYPMMDITIDGADEIDPSLNLIKGGGGCMTMEKIVAYNSKRYIIMVDESKSSSHLGKMYKKGIPVEVIPLSHVAVSKKLEALGFEPVLRLAINKAGPIITDNGNFILDLKFNHLVERDWMEINDKIKLIPGVVETGLFINMAHFVVIGKSDKTAVVMSSLQSLRKA